MRKGGCLCVILVVLEGKADFVFVSLTNFTCVYGGCLQGGCVDRAWASVRDHKFHVFGGLDMFKTIDVDGVSLQ